MWQIFLISYLKVTGRDVFFFVFFLRKCARLFKGITWQGIFQNKGGAFQERDRRRLLRRLARGWGGRRARWPDWEPLLLISHVAGRSDRLEVLTLGNWTVSGHQLGMWTIAKSWERLILILSLSLCGDSRSPPPHRHALSETMWGRAISWWKRWGSSVSVESTRCLRPLCSLKSW